jgi:hypothetical protein
LFPGTSLLQHRSGQRAGIRREIMAGTSKKSTSHEKIRKWAEARGGHPATVKRTGGKQDPGLLRIDFPGYKGEASLEEITWDEFFEKFDEKNLAFLYQEKTATGRPSRFCKLVDRQTAKAKGTGARS